VKKSMVDSKKSALNDKEKGGRSAWGDRQAEGVASAIQGSVWYLNGLVAGRLPAYGGLGA
jgi:hypothetical protein